MSRSNEPPQTRILYKYKRNLYVNLTNRCPCACEFCIRKEKEAVGSAGSLWLPRDPALSEVLEALSEASVSDFPEVVFCGFGEPFCALSVMLKTCEFLKKNFKAKIRVNTNGLGDLINGFQTAPLLLGLVDSISISLNAPDSESYIKLCSPAFGERSYPAILRFIKDAKLYVPRVRVSVMKLIGEENARKCAEIARDLGVRFLARDLE